MDHRMGPKGCQERFTPMDENSRIPRRVESAEERCARSDREARIRDANVKAHDEAVDAMVKTSIDRFGA